MNQQTRLQADTAAVLVVDLQEKLLPAICEAAGCTAAAGKLISAAKVFNVPVIATEQYPAGLGPTCADIREMLPAAPFEKLAFSACTEQVMQSIQVSGRKQIIVVGIEAHVCVQQTVLDLLRHGNEVWLCADAVSSRRPFDRDIAIERMRQAGAIVTTVESVIFEMLGQAGTETFKKILKVVK